MTAMTDPARSSGCIVIGAGLAGLAAAHRLLQKGLEPLVLEATGRPGGVAHTIEQDGFRFEAGPTAFPGSAVAMRRLAGELGLAERMVVAGPAAKRRFVFHNKRLHALPAGPLGLLFSGLLSPAGRLSLLAEPFRSASDQASGQGEPDLGTFLASRIGPEAARVLGGAFVRGLWGVELDQVGARSALPCLWDGVQQHGSLLRAALHARASLPADLPGPPSGPPVHRRDLLSFEHGLGELAAVLATELGHRLRLGCGVEAIEQLNAGGGERWQVRTQSGEVLQSERLVLALPVHEARRLLQPLLARSDPGVAATLDAIKTTPLSVCHLGLGEDVLENRPRGFGYLVPPGEPAATAPRALGTIFPSDLFEDRAPAGHVAISAIYRTDSLSSDEREHLPALARKDLALGLGLARGEIGSGAVEKVVHWNHGLPRYGVGHHRTVAGLSAHLASAHPTLALAGNWLSGISLEETVLSGLAAADSLLGLRQGKEAAA